MKIFGHGSSKILTSVYKIQAQHYLELTFIKDKFGTTRFGLVQFKTNVKHSFNKLWVHVIQNTTTFITLNTLSSSVTSLPPAIKNKESKEAIRHEINKASKVT